MAHQKATCYTEGVSISVRQLIRNAWAQLTGRSPDYSGANVPWEDRVPRRRRGGPPEEDALVPTDPPKMPPRTSATALPRPEPENWDVDALGRPVPDE